MIHRSHRSVVMPTDGHAIRCETTAPSSVCTIWLISTCPGYRRKNRSGAQDLDRMIYCPFTTPEVYKLG